LNQLVEEIDYQNEIHKDANYVTGFMMFFSSYSKNGVKTADGTYKYKKRLLIQLEFTKAGDAFYIDDKANDPNFDSRPPKRNQCPVPSEKDKAFFALDNGQLCPPTCP